MACIDSVILSIIIPVYNSEKTICRCLDSVLCQGIQNFECIIVDDGSIDNSLSICRDYASKHSEIRIIHIDNRGASNARNVGMHNAKGKYITFIDSDDAIEEGTYKDALSVVGSKITDIVCFGIKKERSGDILHVPFIHSTIEDDFIYYKVYSHAVVNKLFSRELIVANGIRFNTGLRICEDMQFSFECMAKAQGIQYIDKDYYIYYENASSVSHDKNDSKRITDYEKVADCIKTFTERNHLEEKYKKFVNYRYCEAALQYLIDYKHFAPSEFRRIGNRIKIWHYSKNIVLSLITFFSSFHIDLFSLLYVKLRRNHYNR